MDESEGDVTKAAETAEGGGRRWVPWTIGGIAAATIIGVVLAFTWDGSPAVAEPTPSATTSSPATPAPASTPDADECSVDPAPLTWTDGTSLFSWPEDQWQPLILGEFRKPAGVLQPTTSFDTVTADSALISLSYPDIPTRLVLIDGRTRTLVWQTVMTSPTPATVVATPASAGLDGVVILSDGGSLVSLDLADGSELARTPAGDGYPYPVTRHSFGDSVTLAGIATSSSSLIVSDGAVVSARDPRTFAVTWSVDAIALGIEPAEGGVPVYLLGEVLLIGDRAYDPISGTPLGWTMAGDSFGHAGGVIVAAEWGDESIVSVSGIDPATGAACWELPAVAAVGAADGLWVVADDGALRFVDPVTGAVVSDAGTVDPTSGSYGTVGGRFAEYLGGGDQAGMVRIHDAPGHTMTVEGAGIGRQGHYGDAALFISWSSNGTERAEAFSFSSGAKAWELPVGRLSGFAGGMALFATEMTTISEAMVWLRLIH